MSFVKQQNMVVANKPRQRKNYTTQTPNSWTVQDSIVKTVISSVDIYTFGQVEGQGSLFTILEFFLFLSIQDVSKSFFIWHLINFSSIGSIYFKLKYTFNHLDAQFTDQSFLTF